MAETSLLQALSYASIFAAIATLVVTAAASIFFVAYLRDKSKSRYDDVHHRAQLSEMRKSYEEQLKLLTLQLSATDQRWKELNHLLLSSQRFEPSRSDETAPREFLAAMGIKKDELKVDPKLVLMLTPFGESFDESYEAVVETCRQVGLTCVRGDEQEAHGDILTHILRIMVKARFVIADIGSRNPNVYYELGLAHALDKPTILISETLSDIPFDVQSKKILIYKTLDELKETLPATLARALATQSHAPKTSIPPAKTETASPQPFVPREAGDGIGLMRNPNDYLCITNDGKTIVMPSSSYIFLRLIPTLQTQIGSDRETYRIAQAHLRPMQGQRSTRWSPGRHKTGTVVFVPDSQVPHVASDACELFLTGEMWANDFYFLDPNRDRVKERGFPFVPTGAVEDVLMATLKNFMEIARDQIKLEFPLQVRAGLVGVQNYRLAVDPKFFAYSEFEGRILKTIITHETTISDWSMTPLQLLKPLFENIYDAASLRRPDIERAQGGVG